MRKMSTNAESSIGKTQKEKGKEKAEKRQMGEKGGQGKGKAPERGNKRSL